MHGCGNDYIFVDEREGKAEDPSALAVKICDRHFSVGGDGLVVVSPSEVADCKMRIFNADGGEAETCGNALRCVAMHIFAAEGKNSVAIETASGTRKANIASGKVSVDMGRAVFRADNLPPVGIFALNFAGRDLFFSAVSVGNPHAVCFVDDYGFERGSGETLCCGSGACAAAAVAVRSGIKKPGKIAVECAGGKVGVEVKPDFSLILTGPAEYAVKGELL